MKPLLLLLTLLVGCSRPEPKAVPRPCHRYLVGLKGTTLVFEADIIQHDGGPPTFVNPDGTPLDMGDRYAIIDRGIHYCDTVK